MDEPWRLDAIERTRCCAAMLRPCEFHQGWDLGYERGVDDERARIGDALEPALTDGDEWDMPCGGCGACKWSMAGEESICDGTGMIREVLEAAEDSDEENPCRD